ncbi:MAG: hypothetical protein L3J79_11830, partial [Candidatus Marinimicrobia bacterium]|nr:hypothetical protein [Candidatus Neomarinimicrobiota bacterium]
MKKNVLFLFNVFLLLFFISSNAYALPVTYWGDLYVDGEQVTQSSADFSTYTICAIRAEDDVELVCYTMGENPEAGNYFGFRVPNHVGMPEPPDTLEAREGDSIRITVNGVEVDESPIALGASGTSTHMDFSVSFVSVEYYCDEDGDNYVSATPTGSCDFEGCVPADCQIEPGVDCDDSQVAVYELDCAGVCGGNAIEDCEGICGGNAVTDECGTCDNDSSNDCVQDCNGDWGGDAVVDACGVCDNDPSNDNTTCVQDCNGVWGGDAVVDACG